MLYARQQATRSHPGKARSYEPKTLNVAMLPMRRKSISLFHTFSTRHHQFPPPFQQKRKNEDTRNSGDQTGGKSIEKLN